MKHILESIKQQGFSKAGKLGGLLFLGFLLLADPAIAGVTYRMTGSACTDSNRGEVFYPNDINGGVFGPGPTLCADSVTAEITMADGYVPSTFFENFDQPGAQLDVESFVFMDGARSVSTDFDPSGQGGVIRGMMPDVTEPAVLEVFWSEGFFLRAGSDGTWEFGLEFGARDDGVCGLGSVEGPSGAGGVCTPTNTHYFSVGTYAGWSQVPEPPASGILALALAALAGFRQRRRQGPVIRG